MYVWTLWALFEWLVAEPTEATSGCCSMVFLFLRSSITCLASRLKKGVSAKSANDIRGLARPSAAYIWYTFVEQVKVLHICRLIKKMNGGAITKGNVTLAGRKQDSSVSSF